jgi:hypothetical protein
MRRVSIAIVSSTIALCGAWGVAASGPLSAPANSLEFCPARAAVDPWNAYLGPPLALSRLAGRTFILDVSCVGVL